jgi:AcrR family transcriptional regulator
MVDFAMPLDGERPWRERRRRRILDAAAQLFAEAPYAEVQVDEIARRAGIGKPTLYRYFPSKEALYVEIFDGALARLEAELAEVAASTGPPRDRLAEMLGLLTATFEQTRTLRLLDEENPGHAERWRSLYRARRRTILGQLRRVIEAGCASGDFRAVDLEVTPALLIGTVRGGLAGAPEASRERIAAAAIELVLDGALASRATGDNPADARIATGGAATKNP